MPQDYGGDAGSAMASSSPSSAPLLSKSCDHVGLNGKPESDTTRKELRPILAWPSMAGSSSSLMSPRFAFSSQGSPTYTLLRFLDLCRLAGDWMPFLSFAAHGMWSYQRVEFALRTGKAKSDLQAPCPKRQPPIAHTAKPHEIFSLFFYFRASGTRIIKPA